MAKAKDAQTQGKGAGRPPLFASPKELQAAIEGHFAIEEYPTLAGLAYALGFCDRSSLDTQADRGEEYFHIIKRARLFIQAAHERGLYKQSCTGHIFWLKNHAGYVDKQEMQMSGDLPAIVIVAPEANE